MMQKRYFFLILASLLLGGCGTSFYYAEFLNPSRVYIPANLYKVGLVDHATAPETRAPIYNKGEIVEYATGMPYRTALKVMDAIIEENEAMGRFNMRRIEWASDKGSGDLKPGKEITAARADSICLWEMVDGLIISEGVDITVDAAGFRDVITGYDENGNVMRVAEFTARSKLMLTMRWRFYDYVSKSFLDDFTNTYEYTLDKVTYSEKEALEFDPREVSTLEISALAAVDYYSRIAPYWTEDFRLYYQTGNAEMYRIAMELEATGDWERAGLAWKELVDDPNTKISHRARFNMAVTNEMLGMPRDAMGWLEMAEEVRVTKDSKKYKERLEKQMLIYDLVNLQLGIDPEPFVEETNTPEPDDEQ